MSYLFCAPWRYNVCSNSALNQGVFSNTRKEILHIINKYEISVYFIFLYLNSDSWDLGVTVLEQNSFPFPIPNCLIWEKEFWLRHSSLQKPNLIWHPNVYLFSNLGSPDIKPYVFPQKYQSGLFQKILTRHFFITNWRQHLKVLHGTKITPNEFKLFIFRKNSEMFWQIYISHFALYKYLIVSIGYLLIWDKIQVIIDNLLLIVIKVQVSFVTPYRYTT